MTSCTLICVISSQEYVMKDVLHVVDAINFSFEGRILRSLPMLDTSHVLSQCNASTLLM